MTHTYHIASSFTFILSILFIKNSLILDYYSVHRLQYGNINTIFSKQNFFKVQCTNFLEYQSCPQNPDRSFLSCLSHQCWYKIYRIKISIKLYQNCFISIFCFVKNSVLTAQNTILSCYILVEEKTILLARTSLIMRPLLT